MLNEEASFKKNLNSCLILTPSQKQTLIRLYAKASLEDKKKIFGFTEKVNKLFLEKLKNPTNRAIVNEALDGFTKQIKSDVDDFETSQSKEELNLLEEEIKKL